MYNPRDPYGRGNNPSRNRNQGFGSSYQYQTLPYGYVGTQTSGLVSKVMGLLAFSFIFATLGAFVGVQISLGPGTFLVVAIAGFIVLFALQALIQKPGINLFLLYLFTFLEGLSLGPLIDYYLRTPGLSHLLGQAFAITAVTSLALALYAWTTKRDFSRFGDYLFLGVILLIVAGLLNILFQSSFFALIICIVGIGIFSAYVLFYVQRAKYMADTLPNAIGLTVSLFMTVLNLFLYILQFLSIMQNNERRR
ncbi:Bax inhibitor-1/YccA family protein [Tengunoibacter tsumagoiensis]|uniref:BAX inhibitor protein n=1 Tax=Tengunoibacter tsumagoiensis TaxID=2014871 RepID=A0A402A2C1_9CHLR|nr:Bax inhibitor-1/YccA family protein [Tengunoibacter tsumagoiensis]GCE13290.1 BAX inhibitor protein [Tengunoibacter tsumagoiensis]